MTREGAIPVGRAVLSPPSEARRPTARPTFGGSATVLGEATQENERF